MIARRDFLIGGACVAALGASEALRPRRHTSLLGKADIEKITPTTFAGWQVAQMGEVLQPREQGSLAAKLYSQLMGRVYENPSLGALVMLAVAYGDTQSDLLQLHRPETCYPAFGFELSKSRPTDVDLSGIAIPARSLVAEAPSRIETITYWTRLGEYLPTSSFDQRVDGLRTALSGTIPDGILVRSSSLGPAVDQNMAVNRAFLRDLVQAIAPEHRPVFVGSALAQKLATRPPLA